MPRDPQTCPNVLCRTPAAGAFCGRCGAKLATARIGRVATPRRRAKGPIGVAIGSGVFLCFAMVHVGSRRLAPPMAVQTTPFVTQLPARFMPDFSGADEVGPEWISLHVALATMSFDDARVEAVREFARTRRPADRRVGGEQLAQILRDFTFDEHRLAALRTLLDFLGPTPTPDAAQRICESFAFDEGKGAAVALLANHRPAQ